MFRDELHRMEGIGRGCRDRGVDQSLRNCRSRGLDGHECGTLEKR